MILAAKEIVKFILIMLFINNFYMTEPDGNLSLTSYEPRPDP